MAAERGHVEADAGVHLDADRLERPFEVRGLAEPELVTDLPDKRWLTDYEIQKRMFVASVHPDDCVDMWRRIRRRKHGCLQT
jgi:hypothetical protein